MCSVEVVLVVNDGEGVVADSVELPEGADVRVVAVDADIAWANGQRFVR